MLVPFTEVPKKPPKSYQTIITTATTATVIIIIRMIIQDLLLGRLRKGLLAGKKLEEWPEPDGLLDAACWRYAQAVSTLTAATWEAGRRNNRLQTGLMLCRAGFPSPVSTASEHEVWPCGVP